MPHFQRQVIQDRFFEVETQYGTEYVLQEDVGKTAEPSHKELRPFLQGGQIESVKLRDGYGARLSAPGYLDATEWLVFDTKAEAEASLDEIEDAMARYGD